MKVIGTFDGAPVHEVILKSATASAHIISWGAVLRELQLEGHNAVLGFKDFEDYPKHSPSFGATCGRVANRIKNGSFVLNDKTYALERNQEGLHHRHGGFKGFSKRNWHIVSHSDAHVELTLRALDGEGGYPANMDVSCLYRLEGNRLAITYKAQADADTIINLLHHSYFNLGGAISDHHLRIDADDYTPSDMQNIPTGEILPVANTQYDFRQSRLVGEALYDHNFMLRGHASHRLREVAELRGKTVAMRVFTNQPALQLYDGHKVNTPFHAPRSGLCLEPQAPPDTPNNPQFGSILLKKGDVYHQDTEFHFSRI
jgi:aldose 1-epimerase